MAATPSHSHGWAENRFGRFAIPFLKGARERLASPGAPRPGWAGFCVVAGLGLSVPGDRKRGASPTTDSRFSPPFRIYSRREVGRSEGGLARAWISETAH
jgi:hypothetical protein